MDEGNSVDDRLEVTQGHTFFAEIDHAWLYRQFMQYRQQFRR